MAPNLALRELWEGLYIEKLPINCTNGLCAFRYSVQWISQDKHLILGNYWTCPASAIFTQEPSLIHISIYNQVPGSRALVPLQCDIPVPGGLGVSGEALGPPGGATGSPLDLPVVLSRRPKGFLCASQGTFCQISLKSGPWQSPAPSSDMQSVHV